MLKVRGHRTPTTPLKAAAIANRLIKQPATPDVKMGLEVLTKPDTLGAGHPRPLPVEAVAGALKSFARVPTTFEEMNERSRRTLDQGLFAGLTTGQIAAAYAHAFGGDRSLEVSFRKAVIGSELEVKQVAQRVALGEREIDAVMFVPLPAAPAARRAVVGALANTCRRVQMRFEEKDVSDAGGQLLGLLPERHSATRQALTEIAQQYGDLVPAPWLEMAFSQTQRVPVAAALLDLAGLARQRGHPVPANALGLVSAQAGLDLTKTAFSAAEFDQLVLEVAAARQHLGDYKLGTLFKAECFESDSAQAAWRLVHGLEALFALNVHGGDFAAPDLGQLGLSSEPLSKAGLKRLLAGPALDQAAAKAMRAALDKERPRDSELPAYRAMVEGWPLATAEVDAFPERLRATRAQQRAQAEAAHEAELTATFPPLAAAKEQVRQRLGSEFEALAEEPGIRSRLASFLSFGEQLLSTKPKATSQEVYAGFADLLGTVERFRGLALTAKQVQSMLTEGMDSNGVRNGEARATAWARLREDSLKDLVRSHAMSALESQQLDRSPLMSVSDDAPMAAYVARHQVKSADQRPYVFRIISRGIDLLPYDNYEELGLVRFEPEQLSLQENIDFDLFLIPKSLRSSR